MWRGTVGLLCIALGACIESGLSTCPSTGRVCGEGLVCNDEMDNCIGAETVTCGNGQPDGIEECEAELKKLRKANRPF